MNQPLNQPNLNDLNKFHFIGIGGIGMSGIVKIMLSQNRGYLISGSDVQKSSLLADLAALGANIRIGHHEKNLPENTQAVVYSSAISQDNPELALARRRGLTLLPRAALLAFLMRQKRSIGVAGAHGKTTTSAMIGLMLEAAGLDPTIIIGGELPQIHSNAKGGKGEYLVAEADESDGTFLLLHPQIAVVTNIERDHIDYYGSLEKTIEAFSQYLQQIPPEGFAVINKDCFYCREISRQVPGDYLTYSSKGQESDFQAFQLGHGELGAEAKIYRRGIYWGDLQLQVPGEHNISNALAAIALGERLGLSFETMAAGLACFRGTGRRYELLGEVNGIQVVDDYAHHPTEVKATIAAARAMGKKRVVAVFQPHRYSRTLAMAEEFAKACSEADFCIVNEIYPAFEEPIPGVSARLIVEASRALGRDNLVYASTQEDVLTILADTCRKGDILLIMGAGNIRPVGEEYIRRS